MNLQVSCNPRLERCTTVKIGGAGGLALLLLGCSSQTPPATSVPLPRVSVVTVQTHDVPLSTELPGRVAAFRTAEVRPQVTGIVLKRLFVEGSEVRAGQQLYLIDPAPYQAAYDSAIAAEASTHALLERYRPLVEANAVSKQDYDNAVASQLQNRAALEVARINLVYTKVLSPISGRISRSFVTEGALVTANQANLLATVQQLDPVYVDVTQPSTALLQLKHEGASGLLLTTRTGKSQVRLKLEDGSDYSHTGTLQLSEVTVDAGTGSITLRALLPNPERLLLPGMFVHEQIQEGVSPGAVLAPQQAIGHDQKGAADALIVGPNDIVELRPLKTGRAVGAQWVVTSGLAAGDRLIVEGLQNAKPGAKVVPEAYRSANDLSTLPSTVAPTALVNSANPSIQ
jgi:membrane fusion protein (multidrug efflux system)